MGWNGEVLRAVVRSIDMMQSEGQLIGTISYSIPVKGTWRRQLTTVRGNTVAKGMLTMFIS